MATQNNDVLGYITCRVGHRASVHRAKRGSAKYFYTRCACGCGQLNGAEIQTDIYNRTEWLGDRPDAPPNFLGESWVMPGSVTPVVQPPEPSNDVVLPPVDEPKIEPVIEPKKVEPEPKGSSVFLVVGGLLLGVAAIAIGRAA